MSDMISPLTGRHWLVDTGTIGEGKSKRLEASPAECAATAAALDLLGAENLVFDYDLKPISKRRFRLRARLDCDVVQACVISLEPVPAHIHEVSDSELVPEGENSDAISVEALDVLNAPVIETYADGRIDLGHIAFELLSVSLEPYPKKPGVELPGEAAPDPQALSPFAALAQLRKIKTGDS